MDPTIFIAVTTAAVVLQAGILVALYLSVRKTSAMVESLASEVKNKILPGVETAHSMLNELRPKVESVLSNVSDSTNMVRAQIERLIQGFTSDGDGVRLRRGLKSVDRQIEQHLDQVRAVELHGAILREGLEVELVVLQTGMDLDEMEI